MRWSVLTFVVLAMPTLKFGVGEETHPANTNLKSSEIIGSSVVTSVSVIMGNKDAQEADPKAIPEEENATPTEFIEESTPVQAEADFDAQEEFAENPYRSFPSYYELSSGYKSNRKKDGEGVQHVIDTLKTIVEDEQKKHETTTSGSMAEEDKISTTSPPVPQITLNENVEFHKRVPGASYVEDDDELELAGGPPVPPPNDGMEDFAKHVVSIPPVIENDTATSAEVHDAIHKISGAILSVEETMSPKPIHNIVSDVLSSINIARNNTNKKKDMSKSHSSNVQSRTPVTTTKPQSTSTTKRTKPSKKSSSKTSKPRVTTTTRATTTTTTTTTTKRPTTTQRPHYVKKTDMHMQELTTERTTVASTTTRPTTPSQPDTPSRKGEPSSMIIMLEDGSNYPSRTKASNKMKHSSPSTTTTGMNKHNSNKAPVKTEKPLDPIMVERKPEPNVYHEPGIAADDPFDESNENAWQSVPSNFQYVQEDKEVTLVPIEYTTMRPHATSPTKTSGRRPINTSRPNEFYDDEIFGYDPYQTFFHGVYVPVMKVEPLSEPQEEISEEYDYYEPPRRKKPGKRRPPHHQPTTHANPPRTSNKPKKPVPTLPDHLHRPRPSHLQYQHGAADDTDPETGLLNIYYEHPGHSYGPDGDVAVPDKLAIHSLPALPAKVRKNFTDHHDHHIQHQHGLGGHGHGHGHGAHGHGHVNLHDLFSSSDKRPHFVPAPNGNPGLEATITALDKEKRLFVDINNRLALRLLSALTNPVSRSSRKYENMIISPFTIISSLGMLFLGARGQTAAQLDGLLQLDDMLTFNPHLMYHNITESFLSQPNTAAAMIRLLVTDKDKGDMLNFYKMRVQHFYEARVEEVDYKFAGHLAQSIINQMIRAQIQRHAYEMINYSLPLTGPMSLLTATFFDGQFAGQRDSTSTMNFIHLAALQSHSARRLFEVPAFSLKNKFRAAYDKTLDATAVELPYTTRELSLIAIMPGKAGEFSAGGVSALKSRLTLDSWTKLMRGFYPRDAFKVVFPRFRHQSTLNLSHTLNRFGLTDMFDSSNAKFKGMNGLEDLNLDSNVMHFCEFGTWEKLSDTLSESSNKNLDLVRILRPHVREHYGAYGEPMSVNEWIFKTRNQQVDQQRSHGNSQGPQLVPDDVSRLRLELERLRRRPQPHQLSSSSRPKNPLKSYSKVSSTKVQFRPRSLNKSQRLRSKMRMPRGSRGRYSYRQEEVTEINNGEEETVLKFERPFLYFLRHNPSGLILMAGQYTEPVQEILNV